MEKNPKILYCHCAYAQVMPEPTRDAVLKALQESGAAYEAVADLCELSARRDPRLKHWAATGALKIAACFPRTVKWLFHTGRARLPDDSEIMNMRTQKPDEVIKTLLADGPARPGEVVPDATAEDKPWEKVGDWVPWFPVIDYERCTNCKQCLNFCLFGVFARGEDDKVEVTNPANCKLNCPACARVCPKVAIIFPKYAQSPINGDKVRESDIKQEKAGVEISSVLKDDIYTALRTRGKKGQAPCAPCQGGPPAQEQDINISHLARLQRQWDIPDEFISSLRQDKHQGECSCPKKQENRQLE